MEMIDGIEFYTAREVSVLKGVHVRSVHRARKSGTLKGRIVGSSALIEKASAEAWNPKHGGWDRARAKRWEKKKDA